MANERINEEDILKFYYVESLDDYWIGRRLDTMYYAEWHQEWKTFVWTHSRYLPWGEHVVAPHTAWKEHTYPSEPKEICFADWIVGFTRKYFTPTEYKRAKWEWESSTYDRTPCELRYRCSNCHHETITHGGEPWEKYCPNCGYDMKG